MLHFISFSTWLSSASGTLPVVEATVVDNHHQEFCSAWHELVWPCVWAHTWDDQVVSPQATFTPVLSDDAFALHACLSGILLLTIALISCNTEYCEAAHITVVFLNSWNSHIHVLCICTYILSFTIGIFIGTILQWCLNRIFVFDTLIAHFSPF